MRGCIGWPIVLLLLAMAIINLGIEYSPTYVDGSPRESEYRLYEDGSFVIGKLVGCLPQAYCSVAEFDRVSIEIGGTHE